MGVSGRYKDLWELHPVVGPTKLLQGIQIKSNIKVLLLKHTCTQFSLLDTVLIGTTLYLMFDHHRIILQYVFTFKNKYGQVWSITGSSHS